MKEFDPKLNNKSMSELQIEIDELLISENKMAMKNTGKKIDKAIKIFDTVKNVVKKYEESKSKEIYEIFYENLEKGPY